MDIKEILQTTQTPDSIINKLKDSNIEIGMIEFVEKKHENPLPHYFQKVGNFELDIIAINTKSNEIVLLDHDKTDFVMQKVAKGLISFLKAIDIVSDFYIRCESNEDLYDDETEMRNIAKKAANEAGSQEYINFYLCIFGI